MEKKKYKERIPYDNLYFDMLLFEKEDIKPGILDCWKRSHNKKNFIIFDIPSIQEGGVYLSDCIFKINKYHMETYGIDYVANIHIFACRTYC